MSLEIIGNKFKVSSRSRIIIIFNVVNISIAEIFYFLIPILLNYPPGAIEGRRLKLSYTQQYIILVSLVTILDIIFLYVSLKDINDWEKVSLEKSEFSTELIKKIRRKCINLPYYIYVVQVALPVGGAAILHICLKSPVVAAIKIIILLFTFTILGSIISLVFSRSIFKTILLNTYKEDTKEGIRIGLKNMIFLQIVPLFIVAILFTSLLGYSRLIKEKGDLLFQISKDELNNKFNDEVKIESIYDIERILKNITLEKVNFSTFIISSDGNIITSDGNALSELYLKYIHDLSFKYDGFVSDVTGETQGAVIQVKGLNENWIVGIKYKVASEEAVAFFMVSFLVLLFLNIIVLYFLVNSLANEIKLVSKSLEKIAEGKNINLDKKLAVTSNDEIGDLVIAFNKIQQCEKENLQSIKEQQAILIEQERLASLGQLIGGIAHNIRTPIMSISGAIEALKDLVYEYRDSIGDKSVTDEDHREIAKEMLTWLDKMKPYCAYMSDVISAVKGQAVQMNASTMVKFTVDELIKRVDLLMKHELKKNHIILTINSNIDMKTEIKGEISNLVQVFDNLIINAVHAYEGKPGIIELKITRSGDNIEFELRDEGKGIPKEITDRLFKEMVTTKGKNGTGLGLYMSYSTIKGRFGGNISFSSEEGRGTTFYITIPCITYDKKEVS